MGSGWIRRGAIVVLIAGCTAAPRLAEPPGSPSATAPTASAPAATQTLLSAPTNAATVTLDDVAARAAHTATTLPDGRVFIVGGCIVDGCGTATAETFLIGADSSEPARGPTMATARQGHSATIVGDHVVVVGGWAGEGRPSLRSVEIYRSATGVLASASPLAQGRGGQAAARLGDGRVLVVGGWIGSGTYTATAEIIDPTDGSVSAAAALPWTADALEGTALADGRVLVTGGQVRSGVGTDAAGIYDPTTDRWQSVGPMASVRFKHTTVALPDGRVLVIGGTTDDRELLATTELFDPRTNAFSPGPRLTEPRYKMSGGAVALDDHRVLIGGGGHNVELLDLATGRSRVVEALERRGSFTTVNPIGDDGWLVLGGYDDRIRLRRQHLMIGPAELERSSR